MSLADLAQEVFSGDFAILEIQLYRRRAFDSHFMFFRSLGKSFCSSFHNKTGELISIHFSEDGINIGKTAVSDPAFLAVQDIIFPICAKRSRCLGTEGVA